MLKSPEKFKNSSPEGKKGGSELEIFNNIQIELMKRSKIDEIEWIEKNSKEIREFFNANKSQFLEIYKQDPNELYALLEMALASKN